MKNKEPLESVIVRRIQKALDIHYPGFYFKVHGGPFQRAGIPDIVGVHKGRFIAIEVKRPSGKHPYSKLQLLNIKKINLAGGIAFGTTSPEHVITEMEKRLTNG